MSSFDIHKLTNKAVWYEAMPVRFGWTAVRRTSKTAPSARCLHTTFSATVLSAFQHSFICDESIIELDPLSGRVPPEDLSDAEMAKPRSNALVRMSTPMSMNALYKDPV